MEDQIWGQKVEMEDWKKEDRKMQDQQLARKMQE